MVGRLSLLTLFFLTACNSGKPLDVSVDISPARLQGNWYIVAHSPELLKDCNCPAFSIQTEEKLNFNRRCVHPQSGDEHHLTGFLEDRDGTSRFNFNYRSARDEEFTLMHEAASYRYLMFGNRDRSKLMVWSKSPRAAAMSLKDLLNKAEGLGFNTSALLYPAQNCP